MRRNSYPEGAVVQQALLSVRFSSGVTECIDIDLGCRSRGGLFPTATIGATIAGIPTTFFTRVCLFVEERGTRAEVGTYR